MELKEGTDDSQKGDLNQQSNCSDYRMRTYRIGAFCDSYILRNKQGNLTAQAVYQRENDIKQEQHKKLSVREPDAVRNPGAVMVHVENASLTSTTMMTSKQRIILPFRFETMTQQAVTSPLILTFLSEETPINGYSAWVSYYGLGHTPEQHKEKDMKNDEQNNPNGWSKTDQILENKDEIVYRNEDNDSREVRIYQFSATYLPVAHQL